MILIGCLLLLSILGIVFIVFLTPNDYNDEYITSENRHQRNARISSQRREFWQSVTREQILKDFDYLIYVLEANFPFFDLVYRRDGLNIREYAQKVRYRLAGEDRIVDAQVLYLELETFFRTINTGHISVVDRNMYLYLMNYVIENPDSDWSLFWVDLLAGNQNTALFYGEFNDDDLSDRVAWWARMWEVPINASFNIIQDYKIAYIGFPIMLVASDSDRENFNNFYNQISNFEHLIVDIRGNPGGWPHSFHELITSPHIDYPIYQTDLSFYKGGAANLQYLDFVLSNLEERLAVYLFNNDEYLITSNLEIFDYYHIGVFYAIYPSNQNEVQSNFNGQIWLLIDENSLSGAEHIASFYKQKNLAIIVGSRGGGHYMDPHLLRNFVTLPNTGIIFGFDIGYPICPATGRSLEKGTPPHFYNFEDMDALETTLELIKRGVYRY